MRRALILTAALTLAVFVAGFRASTPPRLRNAVLISWDGVPREHLEESLGRRELPHLARLIGEGRLVDIEVTDHVTDTRSGHAQMLTGYEPATTGVYSNARFRPIPRGLSVFDRLHQTFGKNGILTLMLTAKPMGLGPGLPRPPLPAEPAGPGQPDLQPPPDESARSQRRLERLRVAAERNAEGEPFSLIKQDITVWDGDHAREAWSVGNKAMGYLDKHAGRRFFAFFHFGDTDAVGHRLGESAEEYNDALIELDRWLGRIVAKLRQKGVYERTLIYVTADHGFDLGTTHHAEATRIFLATNDPHVNARGDQRDIAPTVLTAMGVDLGALKPPLPGKPLRRGRQPETASPQTPVDNP